MIKSKNQNKVLPATCLHCEGTIREMFFDNHDGYITYVRKCNKCGYSYKKLFPLNVNND